MKNKVGFVSQGLQALLQLRLQLIESLAELSCVTLHSIGMLRIQLRQIDSHPAGNLAGVSGGQPDMRVQAPRRVLVIAMVMRAVVMVMIMIMIVAGVLRSIKAAQGQTGNLVQPAGGGLS